MALKETLDNLVLKLKKLYKGNIVYYKINEYDSTLSLNLYVPTKEETFSSRSIVIKYPFDTKGLYNYLEKQIKELHNDTTFSYLKSIVG